MIRIDGERLVVEGAVTLDTVPALAEQAGGMLARVTVVDLSAVTEVDSSAVALALEWVRQAEANGRTLRISHVPASMSNLAALYGVSEFLGVS